MRIKLNGTGSGGDWRCCLCCHVRTGTILLGLWHLVLQILAFSVIAVVLFHPEVLKNDENFNVQLGESDVNPPLPTPLSEHEDKKPVLEIVGTNFELSINSKDLNHEGHFLNTEDSPKNRFNYVGSLSYHNLLGERKLNYQDVNVGIAITFCTFVITAIMVYGAVKGKPSYLMPYFWLQVFDLCIASMSLFVCLPTVREMISKNSHIPFQRELLQMDSQTLSFVVLVTFVAAVMVKVYFISVVWNCYKYLTLYGASGQGIIHFTDPNSHNLLPDLPDYETAVNDPRYMKKPLYSTPPPPYNDIVVLLPEQETGPAPVPASTEHNYSNSVEQETD